MARGFWIRCSSSGLLNYCFLLSGYVLPSVRTKLSGYFLPSAGWYLFIVNRFFYGVYISSFSSALTPALNSPAQIHSLPASEQMLQSLLFLLFLLSLKAVSVGYCFTLFFQHHSSASLTSTTWEWTSARSCLSIMASREAASVPVSPAGLPFIEPCG